MVGLASMHPDDASRNCSSSVEDWGLRHQQRAATTSVSYWCKRRSWSRYCSSETTADAGGTDV